MPNLRAHIELQPTGADILARRLDVGIYLEAEKY